MQKFSSIDPSVASALFTYEPDSGFLRWRHREGSGAGIASANKRFAGRVAGHRHTCTVGKTYVQVRAAGRLHYAHRIIWVMHNGLIPDGMQIDHIDGDGTNNRLKNLRLVTASQNKRNQRKLSNNTSGYTGVYFDKRRGTYSARVWQDGRFITLGFAKTAVEAYKIRQRHNALNGFHENHGSDRPL